RPQRSRDLTARERGLNGAGGPRIDGDAGLLGLWPLVSARFGRRDARSVTWHLPTRGGAARELAGLRAQRSQVRILSPLPDKAAPGDHSGGRFHAGWPRIWPH